MNLSAYLRSIGPGIIFAATSIGVSHVVQSTRAGADFGYSLILLVILAHLVKWPFFQMGPRYASATGESLLQGYRKVGTWAYRLFMLLTVSTMFIVQAAVTIVAAGVLANIVDTGWSIFTWSALVLSACIGLLLSGGYRWLDKSLKLMMVVFAITCVIALVAVLGKEPVAQDWNSVSVDYWAPASIAFMVALVGWMPTTIEVSVWQSFWVVERNAQSNEKGSNSQALSVKDKSAASVFDFNLGYLFCLLFAIVFVVLGARLLFGSGETLSGSAIGFSAQLIQIFVSALGDWSKPVVSLLIFVAMFSTCIAVADGFSHVVSRAVQGHESSHVDSLKQHHKWYRICMLLMAVGGWLVIFWFSGQLKSLIDFATTISFVFAPFFAYINIKAMHLPVIPEQAKLTRSFMFYTWSCFAMLLAFSCFYVVWRFF